MSISPDPHAVPGPTTAEVAAVLHELADVLDLADDHPRRIAAIAAKRAMLVRIAQSAPLFSGDDGGSNLITCEQTACWMRGEPVYAFAYQCAACGSPLTSWPLPDGGPG